MNFRFRQKLPFDVSAETSLLLKQIADRKIPVHALAGVPLCTAGAGVDAAVEELALQPGLDLVVADGRR